jgi:hypothetical protein
LAKTGEGLAKTGASLAGIGANWRKLAKIGEDWLELAKTGTRRQPNGDEHRFTLRRSLVTGQEA